MKQSVRNILTLSAGLLLAALYILTLTSERSHTRAQSCQGLKVTITDSAALRFVSEEDIARYMDEYGPYVGKLVEDVDLGRIEEILSAKSAIRSCEAYIDRDGYIHTEIVQREPVIRFQKGDIGFYADEMGYLFPLQKNYTSRVPIIDGAIPLNVDGNFKGKPASAQENLWLTRIIGLTAHLQRTGWSKRISQISVLPDGNLVLIPTEGKERFLFGTPTRIGEKLLRIASYYEAVAPAHDKGYYSSVDVRFDKQIICKK